MPYVVKDESGHVISLHREAAEAQQTFLPADHPEVLAFLASGSGAADTSAVSDFFGLDLDVIRVIEDLVDTLIHKNLIMLTDLPPAARDKILKRRKAREELYGGGILVNNLKLF